jgi:hypothetical protein
MHTDATPARDVPCNVDILPYCDVSTCGDVLTGVHINARCDIYISIHGAVSSDTCCGVHLGKRLIGITHSRIDPSDTGDIDTPGVSTVGAICYESGADV